MDSSEKGAIARIRVQPHTLQLSYGVVYSVLLDCSYLPIKTLGLFCTHPPYLLGLNHSTTLCDWLPLPFHPLSISPCCLVFLFFLPSSSVLCALVSPLFKVLSCCLSALLSLLLMCPFLQKLKGISKSCE